MRLGVYADIPYYSAGATVTADVAFVAWLAALGEVVDELVVFGRVSPGRGSHEIGGPNVRFVGLPHYASLRSPGPVLQALRGTVTAWRAELDRLDAVLIFGPHPVGLILGAEARRRDVPVVVGVRQDFPAYLRTRVGAWAAPPGRLLELGHRRLGRRHGAVVVGEELAGRYGPNAFVTGVSLVDEEDFLPAGEPQARPPFRALSVTRLDPEKNPLLLVDVLAELRRSGPWTLDVAGDGPLRPQLENVEHLHLHGHLGPCELRRLYRSATVLVHTAWTEGLPQVLYEAAAARLPIAATAVGGVPAALASGRRGLLVPPGDPRALARAALRLADDAALCEAVTAEAFTWVAAETRRAQTRRVAGFIAERTAPR